MVIGLNYGYERALKIAIPAVRIAVAKELRKNHRISEHDIAVCLGIAQAAISKYLNGRYSKNVEKVVSAIESKGMQHRVVKEILSKGKEANVSKAIDEVASRAILVGMVQKEGEKD